MTGTRNVNAVGIAGTVSQDFQNALQLRINWFRAMAGVPAAAGLDSVEFEMDQQAALMMSANNRLNHVPPSPWLGYTTDGATAAAHSNLALDYEGASAITVYISDWGTNNAAAGHRRWLLYPLTQTMGGGAVPKPARSPPQMQIGLSTVTLSTCDLRPGTRLSTSIIASRCTPLVVSRPFSSRFGSINSAVIIPSLTS